MTDPIYTPDSTSTAQNQALDPQLIADAYHVGAIGSPHTEEERALFESYMAGHCWKPGPWDAERSVYANANMNLLYVVFRSRSAIDARHSDRTAPPASLATAPVAAAASTSDDAFGRAWAVMEAKGYKYGKDALENVRLGWRMRDIEPRGRFQTLVQSGQPAQADCSDQWVPYEGFCANCHKCMTGKFTADGIPFAMSRMIVCPQCGNKRCPKATDHALECTQSNEPGQAGSIYAAAAPVTAALPEQ